MMNILAFILLAQIANNQQVIWLGEPVANYSTFKVITAQATIFYDENNKARLIILRPQPDPTLPPAPPPPPGKYGVAPLVFNAVNKSTAVTKAHAVALAKAYRQASDIIDAKIAATGSVSRTEAQDLLIAKTREALDVALVSWAPILDAISGHMKSITKQLPTSKELSEYYDEIAIGLEACNQ